MGDDESLSLLLTAVRNSPAWLFMCRSWDHTNFGLIKLWNVFILELLLAKCTRFRNV